MSPDWLLFTAGELTVVNTLSYNITSWNSRVREAAKLGLATLEHLAALDPNPEMEILTHQGARTGSQVAL